MVLRSKKREEAIQLITMDPKVCGNLLATHRRGKDVDVEALHGRFPLRRSAGEGSKKGSREYKRLGLWKQFFVVLLDGFGVRRYIQAKEVGQGSHEGPTRQGAPPRARPPPLPPPHGSSDLHSKYPGSLIVQEKSIQLAKQTKVSEKKYEAINIMHIRVQRRLK